MASFARHSSSSSEGAPAPEVARQRTPTKSKGRHFGMSATMNATLQALSGSNRQKRAKNPPTLAPARPQSRSASMTSRTAGKSGISAFRYDNDHDHDHDRMSSRSDDLSVDLDPDFAPRAVPAVKVPSDQTRVYPRTRISEGSATPESREARSIAGSHTELSADTGLTSVATLPALQTKSAPFEGALLQPVAEDDPNNYNLYETEDATATTTYSLETRGEQMFSVGHLRAIFDDPALLMKFTSFLSNYKKESIPTLIYYLDAVKALRSIRYANAIAEALEPLQGLSFTDKPPPQTTNLVLEDRARAAFEQMVREDLPAYITRTFINVVSISIHRRVTGTLPPHLREASEGLAEVFCLSDPSRPDNPIVFASEEFHRTTQYGVNYAIGRNCRFLQGPRTNKDSVRRIKDAIAAGKDHSETFVNYRRDGSPFLNLLMCAPLRDSRGTLRYFIGAQVDVSGLAKEATDLEGLQRYLASINGEDADGRSNSGSTSSSQEDEFRALAEMFNHTELDTVRSSGGKMHREHVEDTADSERSAPQRPRLLLKDNSDPEQLTIESPDLDLTAKQIHGRLTGVYSHYLLLRPYPSLRILFTSPSLRVPGMLQSKFLDRIGSSERVRSDLTSALAAGRGVTAKVKWLNRTDDEHGRSRWIHCTPLLGHTGAVGVWMVVLVDDAAADQDAVRTRRRFRPAPPVPPAAERKTANKAVEEGEEARLRPYTIGQPSIVSARSSDAGEPDFRF